MEKVLKMLRKQYQNIQNGQDLSEEKIKIDVVREVFLKEMGYDVSQIIYEKRLSNGAADMSLQAGDDILTIETKAANHTIVYKDIEQLIRYLNTQGREWGILTNGKDYILLNAKIETKANAENKAHFDNIVFWFDVFVAKRKDLTNIRFFSYLSKHNIFERRVTYFFKDIAQLKAYEFGDNEKNWIVYKSTLSNFFDFYVSELGKIYRDRALEKISIEDFERFIEHKKAGKKNGKLSNNTIKNNWSHINCLFLVYCARGKMSYNPFGEGRIANLGKLDKVRIKNENNLNETNVSRIIRFYASRRNPARNIALFLLCAIMGFERSDLMDFKWEQIDFSNGIVMHSGRLIKCPQLLLDCLMYMYKNKGRNRLENVFCTSDNGRYSAFKAETINDIFDRLQNIDDSPMWKAFSPKYVKNCSVELYYECGYSLDEILYWTCSDLDKLSNFFNSQQIYQRVESQGGLTCKREVLGDILDSKLEQWLQ